MQCAVCNVQCGVTADRSFMSELLSRVTVGPPFRRRHDSRNAQGAAVPKLPPVSSFLRPPTGPHDQPSIFFVRRGMIGALCDKRQAVCDMSP